MQNIADVQGTGPDSIAVELANGKIMDINCSMLQFVQGMMKYRDGAMMQDAFPFLGADEREFLISGTTPEEWVQLFGVTPDELSDYGDDDEDDDD